MPVYERASPVYPGFREVSICRARIPIHIFGIIRTMKRLRTEWPLGFFGFFGLLGVPDLLTQDWLGAIWLVWVVWFLFFIPVSREGDL